MKILENIDGSTTLILIVLFSMLSALVYGLWWGIRKFFDNPGPQSPANDWEDDGHDLDWPLKRFKR